MNTQVDRQVQERQIRQTIRLVKGYWYRAGVPRSIRRERAEELHTHLEEAVADGRRVSDVVGTDLAAFAAEWYDADVQRPWLELLAQVIVGVLVLPALGAAAYAWLGDADRLGLPASMLASGTAIFGMITVIQTSRWFRTRLTPVHLGILIVVTGAAFTTLMVASFRLEADDRFVAIPPAAVAMMLAAALAIQATLSWMKRTHRL